MNRLYLAFAAAISIDQVAKAVASSSTHLDSSHGVIGNTGALAGMFPAEGVLLLVIAALALGAFLWIGSRLMREGRISPLVLGLLAGGAVGNLIDRAILGYVRDFIWTPWLVINVADIFLAIGAIAFSASVVRSVPPASSVDGA